MTKQITVRIPEELLAGVDAAVREGREQSRASAVTRALRAQQRREFAERDVEILRSEGASGEGFEGMADYARTVPLDID